MIYGQKDFVATCQREINKINRWIFIYLFALRAFLIASLGEVVKLANKREGVHNQPSGMTNYVHTEIQYCMGSSG